MRPIARPGTWSLVVLLLVIAGAVAPGCRSDVTLGGLQARVGLESDEPARKVSDTLDSVRKAADGVQQVSHQVRGTGRPDLSKIYGRSAKSADIDRNPVIVIPGILGSRLVDEQTRRVVWGEFGGDGIDPKIAADAALMAMPMQEGRALADLRDTVRTDGALDKISINVLGLPIYVAAYGEILATLGAGGYRDPVFQVPTNESCDQHLTCFQFAYDWRRDNAENAALLHQFILEKKQQIEAHLIQKHGQIPRPVRFDIVAHSMGGLVARYYLQYGHQPLPEDDSKPIMTWAGCEHVERLIQIGTPNAGSANAVEQLVEGMQPAKLLPKYEAALIGTMPVVYQLLPRTRHRPVVDASGAPVDLLDPATWEVNKWGLLDPAQDRVLAQLLPNVPDAAARRRIAFDHLWKCLSKARAFQRALDEPARPPEGTSIHLIAGDAHETIGALRILPDGKLEPERHDPGDGTVTRANALMDERQSRPEDWQPRLQSPVDWSSVTFLFTNHLGLTSDPAFTDNTLYLLLEAPRR